MVHGMVPDVVVVLAVVHDGTQVVVVYDRVSWLSNTLVVLWYGGTPAWELVWEWYGNVPSCGTHREACGHMYHSIHSHNPNHDGDDHDVVHVVHGRGTVVRVSSGGTHNGVVW